MSVYKLQSQEKYQGVKWLFAALLMTFVFLLINYGLLNGEAVGIWDVDGQAIAYQTLVADHIKSGRFLLWDPWSNGGIPLAGDAQIGAFSPLNIAIGFLSGHPSDNYVALWLFTWWLGGMGVLLLGRHFTVSPWASLVIALEYLFIGLYITNAEHASWIIGFSFLPLIIWRLDTALISGRYLPAIQAGALWGLSALSCYPGFTIATALYSGLWIVIRMFCSKDAGDTIQSDKRATGIRTAFLILICFVGTGTMILSPTYFFFLYEGAGTTTRVGTLGLDEVLNVNPLHPGALSTLASPYIAVQKMFNPTLWPGTDVSMTGIYAGIIPVFALFALYKKSRFRKWIALLGLFMLGLALARVFPFRSWLYEFVFPTRFFRHSALFRAYFLFSMTVLGLLGIKDLSELMDDKKQANGWSNFTVSGLLVVSCTVLVFLTFTHTIPVLGEGKNLAWKHLILVWSGVMILPFLGKYDWNNLSRFTIPLALLCIAVTDIYYVYRISNPIMMSRKPDNVTRWQLLDRQHISTVDMTKNGLYRKEASAYEASPPYLYLNNDQMINKIPVLNSYTTQINKFHMGILADSVLRNAALNADRIWFSENAIPASPDSAAFSGFARYVNDHKSIPLVVHSPAEMLTAEDNASRSSLIFDKDKDALQPIQKIGYKLLKYMPKELIMEVAAPSDGWLLVTDRWARSWKVTVNGMETEVWGGNFIFRAVQVKQGINKIHFYYQPFAYPYLLILSWSTLLIVALFSVFYKVKQTGNR